MTVRSSTSAVFAAATSFPISLPVGVQVGDRLLVFFSHDNATNVASTESTGWIGPGPDPGDEPTWRVQEGGTTNLASNLFSKVATGSDALVIGTTESQEAAVVVVCLEGDGGAPTVLTDTAGTSSSSGGLEIVVPTFNGASGDYDSVVFLGLDANPPTAQGVDQLTNYSTVEAAEPGGAGTWVGSYEQHRSLTGVSSISPGTLSWANSEQSIVFHVVVPQDTGPTIVEKDAADSATGTDSADVDISVAQAGSDAAITGEAWSADAELGLADAQQGTDELHVDSELDGGIDPATSADEAHIVIPADDQAGEGPWSYHVDADLGLTEPGTGADGASIETLFGDLVISLYGVDPATGVLVPLPDFVRLTLSPERNARGSIDLRYPANGLNFDLLRECVTASRDLEVEVWSIGSKLGALRGYLQEAAGDDTEEDAVWQFGGGFLELRMDEAVVFPQDRGSLITDPDTGEQTYSNAKRELIFNADTPGAAMLTILDQAQVRGALDGITWDFTTEADSNGTAWSQLLTAKFSPGSTYTQILDKLVELGLAEWAVEWDGTNRVLRLWEPEGRGVDRTTGPRPIILRKTRNLLSAPRKWSVRDAVTTMLAAGQEGVYDDATDLTALARRDRRIEGYSSLGNASDEAAVLAWAQQQLTVRAAGVAEVTHGLGFLPGEPRPIIAFNVGDWVYSQVDNVRERLRVVQWTLTVDAAQQPSGTVTLNDTMTNALVRMQRRLNQIAAGEAVVGTSEPPSNSEPDTTPPAMPEGLAATSFAYQDPSVGPGQTLAMVSAGWLPVTTNADGSDDPRVQAAVYIRDKMFDEIQNPPDPESPDYAPLLEDWTWKDCPQVVQDFNDVLLAMYAADGSPPVIAWLGDFIDEQTQTPTAADDITGYRVRYSYLGLEQVGGLPSSDPFPEDDRVYYEATPPGGTSATSFAFGGVEGGSRLRIEVAALDRAGNQGAWASISHDTSNDATPPPAPSAPTGLKTWFRTMDVPWDGLGSEGEAMPVDFSHVRVWVGQGAAFTLPSVVAGPVPFDPLDAQPQYVRDIPLGAGTVNIPDLPYGPGWYAALQAVDQSGNASALSPVVGPVTAEQLFPDDLRDSIINDPNMIAAATVNTLHVVDAAIIGAKIAEATIEEAHIATVNAGSITAGTMTATVTVSGGFWTSLDVNESRLCFTGQGLQLFRAKVGGGSDLVGEWRTSDGSMLITGTYRSGTSGQRIHIDPDGTMSFYAQAGANPSRIINEGNDVVWRGPLSGGRSGRLNVNALGVGLNYGSEADIPASQAEFLVLDRQTRMTAAFMNFQIDERKTSPVGGVNSGRRIQFSTIDSSGDFIPESGISYMTSSADSGGMVGNGAGFKLEANKFMVTNGDLSSFGTLRATNVEADNLGTASTEAVKDNVADIRATLNPVQTIRQAKSKRWSYVWDTDQRIKFGPVAEDLPDELLIEVSAPDGSDVPGVSLNDQVGVLWGAMGQVLEQEIRTVHASVTYDSGVSIWKPGSVRDVELTWDSEPLDDVRGAVPRMDVGIAWQGKLSAAIKEGSITNSGCVVTVTAHATVAISGGQPLTIHADGIYLYTPPWEPLEESA